MKKKLRNKLIKIRKKNYLEISSNQISKIFDVIKTKYKNVKVIGGYIPINYEYDCLGLLKYLESKNFKVCLPVIRKNFQMNFYNYTFKDPLRINSLGIQEPIKTLKTSIPDLIFVPLVGYDQDLNRLGYGGGFYDRTIAYLEQRKKITTIGIGFYDQKIDDLPRMKFDKKLDLVITENGVQN